MLKMKRVYDMPSKSDGTRVLVDRIWPRGMKKEDAHIVWWAKELAPSTELREWFGHDPGKYDEFSKRYRRELEGNEALTKLEGLISEGQVTLVYGAKDEEHNQARVLLDLLNGNS